MASAEVDANACPESTDAAAAHGKVLPIVGIDTGGVRALARSQSADPEVIAVDGDVVGGDGDGVAVGDVGRQVLAQAPGALGADGRGQGVDEPGAVVVALRGL